MQVYVRWSYSKEDLIVGTKKKLVEDGLCSAADELEHNIPEALCRVIAKRLFPDMPDDDGIYTYELTARRLR